MAVRQLSTDVEVTQISGADLTEGDWTQFLNKIGKVFSSVNYGEEKVEAADEATPLNSGNSLTVPKGAELLVYALDANTGKVYVGDSSVSTSNGMPMSPRETITIKISDVSTINIAASNVGDGVRWLVESD